MFAERVVRFVQKSAREKRVTIRYFARKALAKLPYVPVHTRLSLNSGEDLRFWWSCVPSTNHSDRSLTDYWDDDASELRFLWQFLDPGMVFFDIGAYHGLFSVIAAKKLCSQGRVVAFEPSARDRRRYELHSRMNGLRQFRLESYAVGAKTGRSTFYTVSVKHTSMNSLRPPPVEEALREVVVDTISLDEYLENSRISRIDLMKIDVEGGELDLFRGAQRVLTSVRPILICEVLDWVTQPWGYPAREIMNCLLEHGYSWFDFREDGKIFPHVRGDEYPATRNYLAVPNEKRSLVERWLLP